MNALDVMARAADALANGGRIDLAHELREVRAALSKLRNAAHNLEVAANTVDYCYDRRPENFAVAMANLRNDAIATCEAVALLDGAA